MEYRTASNYVYWDFNNTLSETDAFVPPNDAHWDAAVLYAAHAPAAEWSVEWADLSPTRPPDAFILAAVGFVLLLALSIVTGRGAPAASLPLVAAPVVVTLPPRPTQVPAPALPPDAVVAPYDSFVITQGLHGHSYGHMAIDLKAGHGAIVRSPIQGQVTALYVDEIGNPTLVIENDYYRVVMLHGEYGVAVGDLLALGQPVGTESNLGNTRDWQGHSCRGRHCGYHTHLNIFDKRLGANVNPLALIQD